MSQIKHILHNESGVVQGRGSVILNNEGYLNSIITDYYNSKKATQVLPWLYLAGQAEVADVIDKVDYWIDFRDECGFNREIIVPRGVQVIRLPFNDGDVNQAKIVYPIAKAIANKIKKENKILLVSCHIGVSRSATFAYLLMMEELGVDNARETLNKLRPIANPNLCFSSIVKKWEAKYYKREARVRQRRERLGGSIKFSKESVR